MTPSPLKKAIQEAHEACPCEGGRHLRYPRCQDDCPHGHFGQSPEGKAAGVICIWPGHAAIRSVASVALLEAIDWVQAEARDCGCSGRIEARIRGVMDAAQNKKGEAK